MTTIQKTNTPEDQPFDHEAIQESNITRHNSQTKLINHENSDGSMFPGYDPDHPDTGYNYHHHGGPSEYNLVDKAEAYPGAPSKLHDLGELLLCRRVIHFPTKIYRIFGSI